MRKRRSICGDRGVLDQSRSQIEAEWNDDDQRLRNEMDRFDDADLVRPHHMLVRIRNLGGVMAGIEDVGRVMRMGRDVAVNDRDVADSI